MNLSSDNESKGGKSGRRTRPKSEKVQLVIDCNKHSTVLKLRKSFNFESFIT